MGQFGPSDVTARPIDVICVTWKGDGIAQVRGERGLLKKAPGSAFPFGDQRFKFTISWSIWSVVVMTLEFAWNAC